MKLSRDQDISFKVFDNEAASQKLLAQTEGINRIA